METLVNLLCNLHNLLLLQRLRHLNQFGGITLKNGFVHVASIRQTHDDIPAHLLGKDLKRTRLFHLFCQYRGIPLIGNAQQQSILITLQSPHAQIACRRNQRTIIVVDGIAQHIIIGIDLSTRLQKFHLVHESSLSEHSDSLFQSGLSTTERHIGIDNLLHPLTDAQHILVSQWRTVFLLEVAIDTSSQRVFDKEFTARKHVNGGLIEHETERTGIDATSRTIGGIDKLDITILEHTELQTLRHIIHLRRNHGIRQIDISGKLLIDIEQRSAFGKTLRLVAILTADLEHSP